MRACMHTHANAGANTQACVRTRMATQHANAHTWPGPTRSAPPPVQLCNTRSASTAHSFCAGIGKDQDRLGGSAYGTGTVAVMSTWA